MLKYEIPREELFKLLSSSIGSTISTHDISWWLETKTEQKFTVVQVMFIKEVFKSIELQNAQNAVFYDKWSNSLDIIKYLRIF